MKAKVIKTGEIVDVYHESQHGQITNIYKESVLVNGRMWTEDELDFSINLESKEVDLEREINDYFITVDLCEGEEITENTFRRIAKHFYERGLQARINKELVGEIYSHVDSIKDTADRMTSGNFMHNRAAIKFSANTIVKVLELMDLKA